MQRHDAHQLSLAILLLVLVNDNIVISCYSSDSDVTKVHDLNVLMGMLNPTHSLTQWLVKVLVL